VELVHEVEAEFAQQVVNSSVSTSASWAPEDMRMTVSFVDMQPSVSSRSKDWFVEARSA
jgi:hypothetical protein